MNLKDKTRNEVKKNQMYDETESSNKKKDLNLLYEKICKESYKLQNLIKANKPQYKMGKQQKLKIDICRQFVKLLTF